MSTLRISNIEAKADSSSPTVDEQLRFTNSDGDLMLYLDGRTAGITTVGINTTNQTIKFDANNNVMVTGIITATEFHGALAVGTSVTYGDNEKAYFGTGLDMSIYHNGSNTIIKNDTGELELRSNVLKILGSTGAEASVFNRTGSVDLMHNGTKKFETTSSGISVTGNVVASGHVMLADNLMIRLGTGYDFELRHTGSHNYINTQNGNIELRHTVGGANEAMLKAIPDGAVMLYHNGSTKLETTNTGALVTGILTATSFVGALTGTASGNPTLASGANNRVITATGANALTGESALTYSGNIFKNEVSDASGLTAHILVNNSESSAGVSLLGSGSSFSSGGWAAVTDAGIIRSSHGAANGLVLQAASGDLRFYAGGNPPAERLRINSSGNALFGGTAVSQTNRQLALGSNAEANFAIETHNNAFSESSNIRFYKSRGTAASPTAVADGHYISQLMFYGHDGTDYANTVGYMRVLVDGTVASNQVPGQIQLGVNDGSSATTAMTIHKTGSVLFSGLTDKNDPRNAEGIAIKSPNGISIQNFGANGSHNWRIRPDDLTAWGTLEFSVSPTSNSATDWPDATSDVVLTLQSNKDVKVNNGNLVIGTAGKGIDFSPTTDGGSGTPSELLDDYEEGYFAPEITNLSSGYGSGTFYNRQCRYTKVGNMVTCWGHIQWWGNAVTSGADNQVLTITGFPFEVDGVGYRGTCGGSVVAQSWRYAGTGFNNYNVDSDNVQVGCNASEQIQFFVYKHNSITGQVTQKSINGYNPNIEFCFQVRVTSYK